MNRMSQLSHESRTEPDQEVSCRHFTLLLVVDPGSDSTHRFKISTHNLLMKKKQTQKKTTRKKVTSTSSMLEGTIVFLLLHSRDVFGKQLA